MFKYNVISRDLHGTMVCDEVISTFEIESLIKKGDVLNKNFLHSQRVVKEIELSPKSKLM